MASLLKSHGYRTAAIGKWHLGYGTSATAPRLRHLGYGTSATAPRLRHLRRLAEVARGLHRGAFAWAARHRLRLPLRRARQSRRHDRRICREPFCLWTTRREIPDGLKLPGPRPDDDNLQGDLHPRRHGEQARRADRSRRAPPRERARDADAHARMASSRSGKARENVPGSALVPSAGSGVLARTNFADAPRVSARKSFCAAVRKSRAGGDAGTSTRDERAPRNCASRARDIFGLCIPWRGAAYEVLAARRDLGSFFDLYRRPVTNKENTRP
ncbi:MAG: hypothetical protein M3463_06000 [Verrucomicrobiota bacterium]|nr:hypothetical protein [Verrucomicrobiota bacterium]